MANPISGICMGCMSVVGEERVCPHCGFDNDSPYDKEYARPGSVIGSRYILGRLVRKNGEGGLYIGYDNSLKARVWIREYYPHTIARRDTLTGEVTAREGLGAQYKALMSDFVDVCNEVRRIGVTEPVVPIENVVAERGTVYAVYRDMEVVPLESWLQKRGGKLPVKEARELLLPLYNALSNIHDRSDIHRGISTYTVYVDRDDKLYLWDFCMSAARTGGSELEAELFNGYSAPEQYVSNGWQGTWTDVYGAAALFYRVVSGFVPPKSTLLGEQRPLAPLIDLVMDIPQNISDAVVEAMHVETEHRTQEIGTFVARLVNTEISSTSVYDVSKVSEVKKIRQEKRRRREERNRRGRYIFLGLLITVVALIAVIYLIMSAYFPDLLGSSDRGERSPSSSAVTDELLDDEEEQSPAEEPDLTMPDLTGLTVAQAEEACGGRYVFSVSEDYNDQYEAGIIYDQSPGAGITVPEGRTVILSVSRGTQLFEMPDLVGMNREDALVALRNLTQDQVDLSYYEYTRVDQSAAPGTVVDIKPEAGTEFDPRTQVIYIWYVPGEASEQENETGSQNRGQQGDGQADTAGGNQPAAQQQESSRRQTIEEFEEEWNRR